MGDAFRMSYGCDWQVKSEWAGQHRYYTPDTCVLSRWQKPRTFMGRPALGPIPVMLARTANTADTARSLAGSAEFVSSVALSSVGEVAVFDPFDPKLQAVA
jgi:hypothetical protein